MIRHPPSSPLVLSPVPQKSTNITPQYALWELSRHPESLRKAREEHDAVLGSDPNEAGERLTEDPRLANSLPFTTAIVRETLRLWTPAGSVRMAPKKGFVLPAYGCKRMLMNTELPS